MCRDCLALQHDFLLRCSERDSNRCIQIEKHAATIRTAYAQRNRGENRSTSARTKTNGNLKIEKRANVDVGLKFGILDNQNDTCTETP